MRKIFLLILLLVIGGVSEAYAHASVESSEPKAGEILESAPSNVKIIFSEGLRLNESLIRVYDANKKPVNGLIITKTGDNKTLSYTLPKLSSGVYTVKWKAVCQCTDRQTTRGSFTFTVK